MLIAIETFDSELEKQNAALVLENQALQSENRQLSHFLKEYESTLESVMDKFRHQAHQAQKERLQLQRTYEQLLLAERNDISALHDTNVHLQSNVVRIAHAVAKQYDTEEGDIDDNALIIELETENKHLRVMLEIADAE